MSLPVESLSHTAVLTDVDATFATLTTNHETCEILVDPNGQPNAVGSVWSVWDVSASGLEVKIGEGVCALPSKPCRILIDHEVQGGGFFRLKGRSVKGSTIGAVTATITGYSNIGVIDNSEEVSANVALTNAETTIATLAAQHQYCEVIVNTNGDVNARKSIWRLYDVTGTVVAQVSDNGQLANAPSRIFTKITGVGLFRLTAQSVNGNTAVNTDVALIGYDPFTPSSSGGGITQLTQDVLAGPGVGAQIATLVNVHGAAGVVGPIAANTWNWANSPSDADQTIFDRGVGTNNAVATMAGFQFKTADGFAGSANQQGGNFVVVLGTGQNAGVEDVSRSGLFEVFLKDTANLAFSIQPAAGAIAGDPKVNAVLASFGSTFGWETGPSFGTDGTIIETTAPLALGVTPSPAGILRLPNAQAISVANNVGAATQMAIYDAFNEMFFGNFGTSVSQLQGFSTSIAASTDVNFVMGFTEWFRATSVGNFKFGQNVGDWGGALGAAIQIQDVGTAPTGPVGGGFAMWSDSKRPAWRFGPSDDVLIVDSAAAGDVTVDAKDLHLKVLVNGTRYGIQLYTLP